MPLLSNGMEIIMENISDAKGIIWLFSILFILIVLFVVSSFGIWLKNEKYATISYVVSLIIALFFIVNAIINLTSISARIIGSYQEIGWMWGSLGISVLFVAFSLKYKRKSSFFSKITFNIASILCIVTFFKILNFMNA